MWAGPLKKTRSLHDDNKPGAGEESCQVSASWHDSPTGRRGCNKDMRDRKRDRAGSTDSANIGTSQQFVGGDQTLRLLYMARIVINYKLQES